MPGQLTVHLCALQNISWNFSDIDSPCQVFDGGTPLHIAAATLCLGAAQTLVDCGASLTSLDSLGRIPFGGCEVCGGFICLIHEPADEWAILTAFR